MNINYLDHIYSDQSKIKFITRMSCTYSGEHDVRKKMEKVEKGEEGTRLIPDVAPRIRGSR